MCDNVKTFAREGRAGNENFSNAQLGKMLPTRRVLGVVLEEVQKTASAESRKDPPVRECDQSAEDECYAVRLQRVYRVDSFSQLPLCRGSRLDHILACTLRRRRHDRQRTRSKPDDLGTHLCRREPADWANCANCRGRPGLTLLRP